MKKACKFWVTGKWIGFLLLQLIILRRLVAESSDSCKNLSTGWKAIKVEEKNKKIDYYKWKLWIEQCNLMAEKNKLYEKVGRDCSRKGKIKCTSLVFSVGSEEITYNLPTIKLNTILNFNEKILKIFFPIDFS